MKRLHQRGRTVHAQNQCFPRLSEQATDNTSQRRYYIASGCLATLFLCTTGTSNGHVCTCRVRYSNYSVVVKYKDNIIACLCSSRTTTVLLYCTCVAKLSYFVLRIINDRLHEPKTKHRQYAPQTYSRTIVVALRTRFVPTRFGLFCA